MSNVNDYHWYHCIDLPDGTQTPGHKPFREQNDWEVGCLNKWVDLKGKRVLDIGCRDGFFCIHAERAGASEVVGIDHDLSMSIKEFTIPTLGLKKVTAQAQSVYDLSPERNGMFDVVIFFGVIYHLRFPFSALFKAGQVVKPGGIMAIEFGAWTGMEEKPLVWIPFEESPYEPTSCTFFNKTGMVRTMDCFDFELLQMDRWRRFQNNETERQLHVYRRRGNRKIKDIPGIDLNDYFTDTMGETRDWSSRILKK